MKKHWASGRPVGWSIEGLDLTRRNPFAERPYIRHSQSATGKSYEIGKPDLPGPLKSGQRGALIYPRKLLEEAQSTINPKGSIEFDPDSMRAALLLFDRLDYPGNSMIQFGPEAPLGLENWAGLQHTQVPIDGMTHGDIFKDTLLTAFNALNEREPGQWVLAREAASTGFPPEALGGQSAFILKLMNALPIPSKEVPYDDVLLFRERRAPELRALRHHIESLAVEIGKTGYGGLAETVAFEQFEASLLDHCKTISEANFPKIPINLEVKFNYTNAGIAAIAARAGIITGLNALTAAGFLQGLASFISIESTLGLKRKSNNSPTPFEYIINAHKYL